MKKKLILISILFLFSSMSWSQGCIKGNCINGLGSYTFNNGDEYIGEYKDALIHGRGTYLYKDGDKYVGEWKDDKFHGQGAYILALGMSVYEGEFKDGNFYGQHTSTYAHGHHYVRVSTRKVLIEDR
jgi:hypothetical protein